MRLIIRSLITAGITLLLPVLAAASEAGFRSLTVAGVHADQPISVVLYYPTQQAARDIPMGPFTPRVAPGAPADSPIKGLIVLSHGTGGSEIGHTTVAEALAQAGYLVAALRHPGDNWQDRSLLGTPRYFAERPRQVSKVIDALLASPEWGDRIARDARGPKVGALGHSAGGYTVLGLAGGVVDWNVLRTHCKVDGADDVNFCTTGGNNDGKATDTVAPASVNVADPRVRAVVALAPVGAVFDQASLAAVRLPLLVMVSEKDDWLPPRHHGEPLKKNIVGVDYRVVPNAGHFAFMNTPGMPIPTKVGDAGANPAGFDREAFQVQLSKEVVTFFDAQLR